MLTGGALLNNKEHDASETFVPLRAEISERVAWFIRLRWLAVAGIVLAVFVGRRVFGFEQMGTLPILILAAILLLLNIAYLLVLRQLHGRENDAAVDLFAKVQIVCDLLILTAILHFSGGMQNPFSFFYVFHVVIASILLTKAAAYGVAALCVMLYSLIALLNSGSVPAAYPLVSTGEAYHSVGYVLTTIAAVGSTLFLAVFMATSIMATLVAKEEELERAWLQVTQLEAAKSRFLVLVSHEMKSPIVAIQSILDAIYETSKDSLGEKRASMIDRARQRTEGLLALTKDLLTFSRQEQVTQETEQPETLDMLDISRQTVQLFIELARKRNVRIVEAYPETKIQAAGNPDAAQLVISNLLSNAIRYTPAGGQVKIEWMREEPHSVMRVSDTGIGIPESDMKHLFTEFFRAENAKKFTASGTGLGLAITKKIIERMGGTIGVESREGKGTTFTVRLPVVH